MPVSGRKQLQPAEAGKLGPEKAHRHKSADRSQYGSVFASRRKPREWHALAPLNAPPEFSSLSVEEVRVYPAVELFEERAACALGGYQISSADVLYVAEICRRLDGIALAIELAAGRLPGLGVHGLANSLKESFSILTHGRRMALPRHQTLRATLDWSYQLLSPEDQAALRCMSIFSGSFTLEDATFVMGPSIPSDEMSERLTSLFEKSLVVAISEGRTIRYRLLDTTRAYAQTGRRSQAGSGIASLTRSGLGSSTWRWSSPS